MDPGSDQAVFLAAEDARFYEHEGLNYIGMLRAIVKNLRARRTYSARGKHDYSAGREEPLAVTRSHLRAQDPRNHLGATFEQSLSKDEILALYLNHIYLGHGRYGVEEAARYYFGKHASELDLSESAALAGMVAAPERISPRRDMNRALERRRFVLQQMQ